MMNSVLAGVIALGLSVVPAAAQGIRFAVTDVEGLESLQREWGAFRDKLAELTGSEVDFFPVSNRTAAAEALDAERLDFVLTGPAEYVVMQKRTNAVPVVGFSRPDYFSGIIVMSNSGITAPAQLKGKKIALGDIGSTSSHIGPSQLLVDYSVDPQTDVEVLHTSEPIQWEALKRGDVAAVGMNYMADFLPLRTGEPAPGAFRVIARGPDLPNDLLMAGDHVAPEVVETVRAAFADHGDELIAAIVDVGGENAKYAGMAFVPQVKDADYDYVRRAYAAIGYPEYADFVGD